LPFAGFYGFARKENFGVYDSHFCWNLTSKQHSSPVDAQKEMDGYSPFTISEVIKFAMGQVSGVNRNKYPVQEYIGDKRINPSIVVFPDFAPPANFLNGFSFDLRLDKVTTSQYLLDWCRGRKINLFSPKVLRPEIVKQLSQFLIQLQIADDDNLTEECLHFVKSLNINPVVIAAKDRLSKLRNKFFDFSVIEEPQDQLLPDFDSGKFISSQAVMKGGKVYPSIGAAEAEVGGESLGNWSTDWFYQFKPLTKEVLTASRKEVSHFYIIKP
jgi:hypothetical protein